MRVTLAEEAISIEPETEAEAAALRGWHARHGGIALASMLRTEALALTSRAAVNVWSGAEDPMLRAIGNLATAPFVLDGQAYRSVESFWQGLKLPEAERARIAALEGAAAYEAAKAYPYGATVRFAGEEIPVGTWRHWRLMTRACWAKFTQSEDHRRALIATRPRPIEHRVKVDSKAIPGVVMADIWMRIREALAPLGEGPFPPELPEE